MIFKGQKINKDSFLVIKSEITDDGLFISVKGKKYWIQYPKEIWQSYSDINKELLLDNLTFTQTCHMPAANQKDGNIYTTSLPLLQTFAHNCTLYDVPSIAFLENQQTSEYIKTFFNSKFIFANYEPVLPKISRRRKDSAKKTPSAIILFTAGKESLLNLGLCMELGITPILIYIDEDPDSAETRHKQSVIKTLEEEYGLKVHRIINEPAHLRRKNLKGEETNWGHGTQFLSYLLEVLPFADYYDADYILFGNEYDCDEHMYDKQGFVNNLCFDQTSEWTKQLNLIAKMVTNRNIQVGSLVGALYEMGIVKVLHERYPKLGELQMSCFSDNEEGEKEPWCCSCSKCAWMFAMFNALGIDPQKIGLKKDMFSAENKKFFSLFDYAGLDDIYKYDPFGIGKNAEALTFYMAIEKGAKGDLIEEFKAMPLYEEIKAKSSKLQKEYLSEYDNMFIPFDLQEKIMDICDETLDADFIPKDFRLKKVLENEDTSLSQQKNLILEEKNQ